MFFRERNVLLVSSQVSANGNVLRSEIVGSIKMRVFLSGMPELRLGLNDKVLFENTGREFRFTFWGECQIKTKNLVKGQSQFFTVDDVYFCVNVSRLDDVPPLLMFIKHSGC